MSEFLDFPGFMGKLLYPGSPLVDCGFVVITTPPLLWPVVDQKHFRDWTTIPEAIVQNASEVQPGIYQVSRRKIGNVAIVDLEHSAEVTDRQLRNNWRRCGGNICEQRNFLQEQFISNLTSRSPIYGTDLPRSLLPPSTSGWDLSRLSSLLSEVSTVNHQEILGATVSSLFTGASFSFLHCTLKIQICVA